MSAQEQALAQMTVAQLQEAYAKSLAENEALKAAGARVVKHRDPIPGTDLACRVSEGGTTTTNPKTGKTRTSQGGGISVYGIHSSFPVTMFREQWERLLSPEAVAGIKAFINANADKLSTKPLKIKK